MSLIPLANRRARGGTDEHVKARDEAFRPDSRQTDVRFEKGELREFRPITAETGVGTWLSGRNLFIEISVSISALAGLSAAGGWYAQRYFRALHSAPRWWERRGSASIDATIVRTTEAASDTGFERQTAP